MMKACIRLISAVILFLASGLLTTKSWPQDYYALSSHQDWSVFADSGDCWVASAPLLSTEIGLSGTNKSARLHVTYRDDGSPSAVTFVGRYLFEAGQLVFAEFGTNRIDFFFEEGDGAWPDSAVADERMQAEMAKGTQVVFHVLSPDGSNTVDVFSLLGFKAAANDAANRCGQ